MRLCLGPLVVALLLAFQLHPVFGQVVISEFMASNSSALADQDGEYSDWIELHNVGNVPTDLRDWFLTDDAAQLKKWRFPSLGMAANSYAVVFASGKDRAVAGSQLHANFSLDANG